MLIVFKKFAYRKLKLCFAYNYKDQMQQKTVSCHYSTMAQCSRKIQMSNLILKDNYLKSPKKE